MNNFETVYNVVFEADQVILRVNNGFAAKAQGVSLPFEAFREAVGSAPKDRQVPSTNSEESVESPGEEAAAENTSHRQLV